ncbi:hypothetical protein D3C87_1419950 [compost metagenome]
MSLSNHSFVQHKLIPTALIAGNIAVIHLIYMLAKGNYGYSLWATAACIAGLTIGTLRGNKYLLIAAAAIYFAILLALLIL